MSDVRRVADLRRQLKNARRRAAYWSGRPSFTGFGFSPRSKKRATSDSEYEMAMADVLALASAVENLTGRRPATTDYKEDFRDKFARAAFRRL